jgi:hypothetical protein
MAVGPDRAIATTKDWKQHKAARQMGTTVGPPPQDAAPLETMEHRFADARGREHTRLDRTQSSRLSAMRKGTTAFADSRPPYTSKAIAPLSW